MKLKKLLASILCVAMVLSTMSFSVFAEDSSIVVNRVEAENNMTEGDLSAQSILITFNNVPCIDENMTVQLYHNDELLSTTNATAKRLGQAYEALTTNVVYSGDAAISGSWTTEINAPWTIDRAPNKIVVNIDGVETTFSNIEIAAFSKFEKFDLTAGTITSAYTNNASVWGEGGANANESFVVEGRWLKRLLGSTNFEDSESLQYFQNALRKKGVIKELEKMGIEEGDNVKMYEVEFDYMK